ncbi:acetyl-CoA transporter [Skeletonema marinoi]|uniref:Acetyl-CoA transporter n=1 Tax=Skeletonema marinoi TaxID=267567 RepID=A0AAD8Y4Z1_9STRA|nr:acetyl-CoA transporter [Skeletonema marinoi]
MSESINTKGGLYQGQLRSRARATPPTTAAAAATIMKKSHLSVPHTSSTIIDNNNPAGGGGLPPTPIDHDDRFNYALLLALYTLQGIPMGLSASIPFLIQQKVQMLASSVHHHNVATAAADAAINSASASSNSLAELTKIAYNAQAIFALCSWPFSLKLLWAPIVDACFSKRFGRRKSWLVPIQLMAGMLMVFGSGYVEQELGLDNNSNSNVVGSVVDGSVVDSAATTTGVTFFFFTLYFLMATQDIAVDGWALTMLSRKNRGKGPICNSIGQNIGYFLSYVGFLALNDVESSENLWRPLLRLPSRPGTGLVSLGGFVKFMGSFMLVITVFVGLFKKEVDMSIEGGDCCTIGCDMETLMPKNGVEEEEDDDDDDEHEIDAYEIGIMETYKRLWSVVKLPAVQSLILILLTYRLPCALSDNVKFLKAVEFGLSKQTTALLSPTIILPLGILVPIIGTKIWQGRPLKQFMFAYKFRVTVVALVDVLMLLTVRSFRGGNTSLIGGETTSRLIFWGLLIASTALQAIVHSLQFNAQMTFFAHRVDPAIGGSYMTLLNTFGNLGGTWPSSVVMYMIGQFTIPPVCSVGEDGSEVCTGGRDAYFPLQLVLSTLGCMWIFVMSKRVHHIAELPDDAWRTQIENEDEEEMQQLKKGGKHA